MFSRTTKPDTHESRLNEINASVAFALDAFSTAAEVLEESATDYGVLADDALGLAKHHGQVASLATAAQADAIKKANNLRALIA